MTPTITDAEIIDAIRARGDADVRILKRRRLRPTAGLTGSYFERVRVKIAGRKTDAILKHGGFTFGPQTRERLFFSQLAGAVPIRVARLYAIGPQTEGADGWVLMERLPRGKWLVDWTDEDTLTAVRNLARLHATYLGDVPASLPRPFTDDLDYTLDFLPEALRRLRAKYDEYPHLPRVASERALFLAEELARHPDVFRAAFARSPQTLLHGDYHRGNIVARDAEEQIAFDWQFVCAGPPAYDLAVFWHYLGIVNKPGFLRFIDRVELRERSVTWPQLVEAYSVALRALRPDAGVDAIADCADEALAWEPLRQLTYFAVGMETETSGALLNFAYRDHPALARPFIRWLGVDAVWRMYGELFVDFERRAERLLRGGTTADKAAHYAI